MERLRKRRDFLAAAKADRAGTTSLTVQGRDRKADTRRNDAQHAGRGEIIGDGIRLGFTVTKKTGNAVMRNRIRRRLRAAARELLPAAGRDGFDYVIVARSEALHAPYGALVGDLERALRRLHTPKDQRRPKGPPKGGPRGAREEQPGSGDPDRRPDADKGPRGARPGKSSAHAAPRTPASGSKAGPDLKAQPDLSDPARAPCAPAPDHPQTTPAPVDGAARL